MEPKITFLNHASFSIEKNGSLTLVDPWFSGRIFNNSWSLLKDTDDSQIDYSKLKYISISHEHPDHLHFPTLKHIKSKTDNDVIILYPRRKNPNVKEACEKIGFKFFYLDQYSETQIEEDYSIGVFKDNPEGHDHALIYKVGDKVILNQNDAYLDPETLSKVKKQIPNIDLWLFQFSLAGYYGNSTEPDVIKNKGTFFHEDKFLFYQNYLEPKVSVPFASFVYFCKQYNSYINDYAVELKDIVEKSSHKIQIPWYNENLSIEFDGDNVENLRKWEDTFLKSKDNIEPVSDFVGENIILEKLQSLYKKDYRVGFLGLEFFDYEKILGIDTRSNLYGFFEKDEFPEEHIAGKLPSEELLAYLDSPWGGDTLNITGAFLKKNDLLWQQFLLAREILYTR
jgi:hypothetical protein